MSTVTPSVIKLLTYENISIASKNLLAKYIVSSIQNFIKQFITLKVIK